MSRQMAEQLCLLSAWACMTKDFVHSIYIDDLHKASCTVYPSTVYIKSSCFEQK